MIRSRTLWLGVWLALAGCAPSKPVPVPKGAAVAQNPCASLVWAGFPDYARPARDEYFVCHDGYALEFNPHSRTPMWVVEHLTRDRLSQNVALRLNDFRADPKLPSGIRSDLVQYAHSGYDPGHMAPAEDFRDNDVRMSQSFYLSNTVAQDPDNNRGIWALLERNVRSWASQRGELYVITGPLFSNGQPKAWIGPSPSTGPTRRLTPVSQAEWLAQKMGVPTHLYKVVVDPVRGQAIAFIVPNQPEPADARTLASFAVPVATVESLSLLSFFPSLPPAQAQAIESRYDPTAWPLLQLSDPNA